MTEVLDSHLCFGENFPQLRQYLHVLRGPKSAYLVADFQHSDLCYLPLKVCLPTVFTNLCLISVAL